MRNYILLFVLLLLIGCAAPDASVQRYDAPDASVQQHSNVVQEISKSSSIIYLGFFMPSVFDDGMQSVDNPNFLHDIGANTVGFTVIVPYDESGHIEQEMMNSVYDKTRDLIRTYRKDSFVVMIAPEPTAAYSRNAPEPLNVTIQDIFLDDYSAVIEKLSVIAEQEGVTIFAPMNEPDLRLGVDKASSWGQEILPVVREHYKGIILWKASFHEDKRIDFSGYDAVGFTSHPLNIATYPKDLRTSVERLEQWANEDGVGIVLASEFGPMETSTSQQDQTAMITVMFDETDLDGYFVLDNPKGYGVQIAESPLKDAVQQQFLKYTSQEHT